MRRTRGGKSRDGGGRVHFSEREGGGRERGGKWLS